MRIASLRSKSETLICCLLFVLLCPASARAAVVTYPGFAAPCDTTLQACVTGTTAGNIIEIVTSIPIVELVTIDKSLTVRAAPGFTPDVQGGFIILGAATATAVTIQGLTTEGTIGAEPGAGNLEVNILDNTILISAPSGKGIFITSELTGPFGSVNADIRRNLVNVAASSGPGPCSGIVFGPINDAGSDLVTILENTITTNACGLGSGIEVTNGADEVINAFIFENRVTASGTNTGILVAAETPSPNGFLNAIVANNLVTGQTSIAGLAAAIVSDWATGSALSFTAVDNTVAGNDNGILIDGDSPVDRFTGLVADNIIALNTGEGFTVDSAFTVTNHHNLVFGNAGGDFFTPGPGTLTVDPLFVGSGDFHLQPNSPAVNAGDNSVVPSGIAVDLDSNTRIIGGAVDLGAFEVQDLSVIAIPTLSPLGLAAMACALAMGALVLARRRARDR